MTYPLLVVLEGRHVLGPRLRAASVVYFVSMCCAAIWLDHHWVLDVLLGLAFVGVVRGAAALAVPKNPRTLPAPRWL